MKTKLLAMLCALSVLIGALALSATANSTPTEEKFYVGYAMVDINPYEMDGETIVTTTGKVGLLDSKKTYHNIMPVPLRGTGPSASRLAYGYLMDDNDDGTVDTNDGLKLTCIAIKDSYGNTILMFTMDAIGDMGHTALARNSIVKELGADYGITADRIMVSGTHDHSGVDLTALNLSLYNDTEADVSVSKPGSLNSKTEKVSGRDAFNALNIWRERLTGYSMDVTTDADGKATKLTNCYTNPNNYFVQAAKKALGDLAEATITKGQIEAKADTGESMVFMRHYVAEAEDGKLFVTDSYSNDNIGGTIVGHVSDADETLHAISFDFSKYNETVDDSEKRDPIVLVNWRNHPQFSSGAADRVVSSDYINAFRYQMKESHGYRAAFFQGTGGNTQPTSKKDGENWVASSTLAGGISYGYRLADVTKECLDNKTEMKAVEAGEIKTLQSIYAAKRATYTQAQYDAAVAAIAAYRPPEGGTQTWDGGDTPYRYNYTEDGVMKTITITCYQQADKIISHFKNQSKLTIDIEIDTIMIGENLAIVTCPGEPHDRYSMQAAIELSGKLNTLGYEEYHRIASLYNDWDSLKNEAYGEPLIFGYTNEHHTYIPNALAYNYNEEYPELYSTQSYGSFMTPLAEGEGERMVSNLASMLDIMINGETKHCDHCDEDVIWYPMDVVGTSSQYDHYYLTQDTEIGSHISVNADMCIDLAGHKLHNDQNALNANVFGVAAGATLSIFDSSSSEVSEQGWVVGSNNTGSGGAISVSANGTVNIYGGRFSSEATYAPKSASNSKDSGTMYGGVIFADGGTVNMYGGELIGVPVLRSGGAICLRGNTARLNAYGGVIKKNSSGDCITFRDSIAPGAVKVGGTAVIEDIKYYIFNNNESVGPTADTFKIVDSPVDDNPQTPFTGSVTLGANGITADGETVIGSSTVEWAHGSSVTIADGGDIVMIKGEEDQPHTLVAQEKPEGAAAVVNGVTPTYGYELAQALQMVENRPNLYVRLLQDVTTLNLSQDVTIDLNGRTINEVNVTEGFTLTLKDSKTEDFFIGDGVYGEVKKVKGSVVAANGYMEITDDGTSSYHRYSFELTSVTLSPSRGGMYYKSEFLGDQKIADQVETFGTALCIYKVPDETTISPDTCTAFDPALFGGEQNGTILENIIKSTNSVTNNTYNAQKLVYGRSYIKFKGDTYWWSNAKEYTLQQLVELADAKFDDWDNWKDNAEQKSLVDMYSRFSPVMKDWTIPNMQKAYNGLLEEEQTAEEETLKVLILGNSHSQDSFWLLNDIIAAESKENRLTYNGKNINKVTLGIMYQSGCYMYQHASNAKNDANKYTYHKSTYASDNYTSGWVDREKSTLRDALKDEKWDIVVLQEMNMYKGIANDYHESDTQYVVNYVKRTLGYTPKFMWNMVWGNPEVPNVTCSTLEDYQKNKWIYNVLNPGGKVQVKDDATEAEIEAAEAKVVAGIQSWEDRMDKYYGNDGQTHHNKMVSYVDNYIIGHYGITKDNVVAPGTAVMYALNQLDLQGGTSTAGKNDEEIYLANEQFTYRDYTHLSDEARVMAAYLWYAELFGLENIDADEDNLLNYEVVPGNMRKQATTELTLSAEQQKNIIAAVNATVHNPFCEYTGKSALKNSYTN